MGDDVWTFFGGPRDGQQLAPRERAEHPYSIIDAASPNGRYMRNPDKRRYEWRDWAKKDSE